MCPPLTQTQAHKHVLVRSFPPRQIRSDPLRHGFYAHTQIYSSDPSALLAEYHRLKSATNSPQLPKPKEASRHSMHRSRQREPVEMALVLGSGHGNLAPQAEPPHFVFRLGFGSGELNVLCLALGRS